MKKKSWLFRAAVILVLFCLPALSCYAQDSTSLYNKVFNFPDKLFGSINKKSEQFQQRLEKSTAKYLKKLYRQELKLQRKLAKKDSTVAQEIFGNVKQRYADLQNPSDSARRMFPSGYNGSLDSMQTAFKFLEANKVLSQSPDMQAKVQSALKDYGNVQGKLNQTEFIQNQLRERQQLLRNKLQSFGLGKDFKKYQEQVYYYRAQMAEYKTILENPAKLEAKLMQAVNKIPAFSKFFNKHSQLASLFRLPGNDDVAMNGLEGLQTRGMIMQELEQRLGTGPNAQNYMSQSIASAQSGLDKAKKKLNDLGSAGSDMDMPNFKPNDQKTKGLFDRLELGTNLQSARGNSFLPVTTDVGLSLGYKFSPKIIGGIGASYKVGWGKDIRHVSISHEGVGLRSFYEMKMKGAFWLSAGGELNYRSRFNNIDELKDYTAWQQSALAGVSKRYKISKKVKGNMQLMYDFLHYRNVPRTQPVVFRVGYALK